MPSSLTIPTFTLSTGRIELKKLSSLDRCINVETDERALYRPKAYSNHEGPCILEPL